MVLTYKKIFMGNLSSESILTVFILNLISMNLNSSWVDNAMTSRYVILLLLARWPMTSLMLNMCLSSLFNR